MRKPDAAGPASHKQPPVAIFIPVSKSPTRAVNKVWQSHTVEVPGKEAIAQCWHHPPRKTAVHKPGLHNPGTATKSMKLKRRYHYSSIKTGKNKKYANATPILAKIFILATLNILKFSIKSMSMQGQAFCVYWSKSQNSYFVFWKIHYQFDCIHNLRCFFFPYNRHFLMLFPTVPQRGQTLGAKQSRKIKHILSTQFEELETLKLAGLEKHILNFGMKKFEVWQLLSLPSPDSLATIH